MSQPSPPKPWERPSSVVSPSPIAGTSGLSSSALTMASGPGNTSSTGGSPEPSASTSTVNPPSLPARPAALANGPVTSGAAGSYNRTGYGLGTGYGGVGGYGSYGGMGSYTSPYSRFGGYGGGMYGMGAMGGMGGYGGYGGYSGGMGAGDLNDPNSLMRGMENSTAATFQMIESIVGAFGGFAQMLESTFMATHSSFFAMVRVAEQFGNLRSTLGSILGIFTVLRWIRTIFAKLTGRPLPASAGDLTPANFAHFEGQPTPHRGVAKPSKKPFFFFIAAVFGLPYLMGKLIRALASRQEEEERRRMAEAPGAAGMDPTKLEFCRVIFDFSPEAQNGFELEVKKGDLVAVLSKADPLGNPSQWWRCRARDSRVGYLPSPYLESIVRRDASKQITTGAGDSRTNSLMGEIAEDMKSSKAGDISIEAFQKSQFNT